MTGDIFAPTTDETWLGGRPSNLCALETLPSRLREILVLREMEEMSYNEISIVMDMPSGTVMSTLSRARARLRRAVAALQVTPLESVAR